MTTAWFPFEQVPRNNETYWRAHDTLYNWEYEESDVPPQDNSTIMYISFGVLATVILFIIVMDLTRIVSCLFMS